MRLNTYPKKTAMIKVTTGSGWPLRMQMLVRLEPGIVGRSFEIMLLYI